MGMNGQRHAPAAILPGKTRYPLGRRLGGTQGRSGRVQTLCFILTGKDLDFCSKGLANRPLSYFVQNNRLDKEVQRRKLLSVSYVYFPYQNKFITLLCSQ